MKVYCSHVLPRLGLRSFELSYLSRVGLQQSSLTPPMLPLVTSSMGFFSRKVVLLWICMSLLSRAVFPPVTSFSDGSTNKFLIFILFSFFLWERLKLLHSELFACYNKQELSSVSFCFMYFLVYFLVHLHLKLLCLLGEWTFEIMLNVFISGNFALLQNLFLLILMYPLHIFKNVDIIYFSCPFNYIWSG